KRAGKLFATLTLAAVSGACASRSMPDDAGDVRAQGVDVLDAAPDNNPYQAPTDVPLVDVPVAAEHDYASSIGPVHLAPGEEVTMCVIQRLTNETAQFVRSVTAHLGPASHHLIFYRSQVTAESTTPTPCRGFSGLTNFSMPDTPMLIAQNLDAHIDMPTGTGMHIAATQMVRLELHAINITAAPVDVVGTVSVHTVDDTVPLIPADMLFWGNTNISIPAHTTADVHFFHQPWPSVRVFGLTSHTHEHGTLATISVATNTTTVAADATDLTEVHRSTSWSDPPLTLFDPPLRLEAAQGYHLACHYNNTTSSTISFGEGFNDEMCFMWAYYYPAPRGLQVCAEYSGRGTVCFPP
ncbi:MAG: hypothetical protein WCJ30_27835, partial [Deltaproteobacteria bacterium]